MGAPRAQAISAAKRFRSRADNHLMRRHEGKLAFRRALRATLTMAERILWAQLRGRRLHGYKFRRQHPVGEYVLDFYCPQRKLAIEVDGDSHYVERGPTRDAGRALVLAREGIRILRFTNNQVKEELDGVLATITEAIGTPPPNLPRAGGAGEEPLI